MRQTRSKTAQSTGVNNSLATPSKLKSSLNFNNAPLSTARKVIVNEGNKRPNQSNQNRNKLSIAQYSPDKEPIKTYLRVRNQDSSKNLSNPYLKVISPSQVELSPPFNSRLSMANSQSIERYAFTKVFDHSHNDQYHDAQSDFFNLTTLPLVQDVLCNFQNALLFAYGVTNSGKTYSMQGGNNEGEQGIIPRTLDVIFNSIGDRKAGHDFRPSKISGVESTKPTVHQSSLLSGFGNNRHQHAQFFHDVFPGNPPPLAKSESKQFDLDEGFSYAIWISFAEIYNEKIYDLLESLPSTSSLQPSGSMSSLGTSLSRKTTIVVKRKALGVRSDKDAEAKYIEGLREVRCDNPEQARALLELGTHNRQVFSTLANRASSRSHSIFNIRVMKVDNRAPKDPNSVTFSRLSLVDLAGSERSKNTGNTGERLREAGNINKSLMVLGQCMEILRSNQRKQDSKKPTPVPFRHSKLTEIFQSYFVGDGKAVMLVHCNPYDTSFIETSHVMKFSAVARDVNITKTPSSYLPKMVNSTLKGKLGAIKERIGHTPKQIKNNDEDLNEKFVNVEVGDQSIGMEDERDTDEEDENDIKSQIEYSDEDEDESEDEDDPFTEFLFQELQEMKDKWLEAEMRCAEIEMETRQECLELMREQLSLQEVEFAERLRVESEQSEINTNKKIELVNQLHQASHTRKNIAQLEVLGEGDDDDENDNTVNYNDFVNKENNDSVLNTPTINRDNGKSVDDHQLVKNNSDDSRNVRRSTRQSLRRM